MSAKSKTTKQELPPQCVTLWQRARDLCGKGIESLYERATILVQLADDEDFLRRFVGLDETINAIFQREALRDTTVTFPELRTILEFAPNVAAWQEKGLAVLLEEAAEANASGDQVTRERISWKARCAELEEEISRLRTEIRRLQDENRELRKLVSQPEPVAA